MIYRISNSLVLNVLILKFFILYINAIPPPPPLPPTTLPIASATLSLNSCNCIRAKDCVAYAALVQQLNGVIERMRNAACGLAHDSEPMICCPASNARATNKPERSYDDRSLTNVMRERWIWDRRPIMNQDRSQTDSISIQNKFYDEPTSNLLDDYYDWKTQRNCPPILYREKHNFRTHFHTPHSSFHHAQAFHHHPHYHAHQPHHHRPPPHHHFEFDHNHYHGSVYDFDNDDDDDYNSSHEGAFIHPDERHAIWPTQHHHWPTEPATSASSNRGRPTAPTTSTSFPVNPAVSSTSTTGVPLQPPTINSPNCGVTLNKRIIGGIEALPGEFPWITRIAYINNSDSSIAYRCSGSFITELHIITAAHCVTNLDAALALSHIRIVDLDGNNEQQDQNIYDIANTIVHPNFDRPKRANDIAIIKINKELGLNFNYGTICLPKPETFRRTFTLTGTGVVAGWSNNEGNLASDLRVRYLKLPLLNNCECASRYDMFRQGFAEKITISQGMLCTQGLSNGSDVCRGDSGGPLMDDGSAGAFNGEGRYTLIGIVAFGPICGFTNLLPGVYMRVSEFVGWIANAIN